MTLFHYTCEHHQEEITRTGVLIPHPVVGLDISLLWLTDLDIPWRDALGLTSQLLNCDRTAYRFVVPRPVEAQRWINVRRQFPPWYRRGLESAHSAMPMHWWLTTREQAIR